MVWRPNVVVAAIVQRDDRYLLVEEDTEDGRRFNQPAGHLENGESLLAAVRRETLEETAYRFEPTGLVGIYRLWNEAAATTYLRFAFSGLVHERDLNRALDEGIVRADWFTVDEIRALEGRLRSPLVLESIEDHLAGRNYPLDMLHDRTLP